ncbi:HIT family protein [Epilithonimonas pallida]|uniref:HIT domain-containing protein n=1 Tax=Epilithonimonas pallida TaxID=373671 RepID=A0ABY1QWR7_9FLAO|nr:HIT domain-containing protein [Epilithonimonas pallida]SMP85868.1 HIT domain-containing protein [Epilithonimonas pallida]
MKDFTTIPNDKILFKGNHFFIIEDRFPVLPSHLLIISNDVRTDFFELTEEEKNYLLRMIEKAKEIILAKTST